MKLLLDMSSVMWTSLSAGTDVDGTVVVQDDKKITVPTCAYGYENAVNMIVAALREQGLQPRDMIMVFEGKDSKSRRCMIDPTYKAGRGKRVPEAYEQFNLLKEKLKTTFRNLGAMSATQDFVEGDDILAYLANNLSEDCIVMTNDNDLCVLQGVNPRGGRVHTRIGGAMDTNKYGMFDVKLVTLYKSLVGDSSDNIRGCPGFGPKAWDEFLLKYDEDGCHELMNLIRDGKRNAVAAFAEQNKCKYLAKIVDKWDDVVKSFKLASLHPEWINTVRLGLELDGGMVRVECSDERLKHWKAQTRLVTADNYDAALAFFKSKIAETKTFTIDFETTTPEESDDWLETRGKGKVDVIGSTIVSCGITFGANDNYGFYISVDHAETNNCTLDQLADFLASIPKDKYTLAHNAAGFELPVAYNAFGEKWKDNGWRGFLPNVLDTRIAASFWDENQPSHGLKQLSKLLLDYEQTTYEEVTTKEVDGVLTQVKMHQLTAAETVAYGLDDVFTTAGLWNYFSVVMQLEGTYDAFIRLEQKPMYLSALAYVQGLKIDLTKMKELETKDKQIIEESRATIEGYLLRQGWEGSVCPVYTELTPAAIKEVVSIVLGMELKTMVRTVSKLAKLVAELDHESAATLAVAIEQENLEVINGLVKSRFTGKPNFNVGSPNQISKLLYEVVGLPVRLRNKPTEKMRAEGKREGTARTDDSAIGLAIKLGDASEEHKVVLKALLDMKSANTRHGLYWSAYPHLIHWKTGRIHPELRQSSTNTRRWTSGSPNIQQMDSNADGIRSCILADNDFVVISEDEQAQEVRLMAELCQDPALLACYSGDNPTDVHSLVGAQIAKCSYEKFMARRKHPDTKDAYEAIRKNAKVTVFSTLYGATAPKVAEILGITESEAQEYIDAIFKAFPGIKAWKETTEEFVQTQGYVELIGGTRRHLARLVNSENKYESSKALRQAGNSRIQASGANQLKTIMSDVWDSDILETTTMKWMFVAHDEAVVQAHKSDATVVAGRLHSLMVKQFMSSVPSASSVGIGKNYGQLVELEFPVFDSELVQKTVNSLFTEKEEV